MQNIESARREELEIIGQEVGYSLGVLFVSLARGFMDALQDAQGMHEGDPDDEGDIKPPSVKTQIEDCRACMCDACRLIETCKLHLPGVDIYKAEYEDIPTPCIGCKNGMRFRPEESDTFPAECKYEPHENGERNNG